MTSRHSRPQSQAGAHQVRNPNATPQRTRVVYKNAPEQFSLTEKKTTYEDSFTLRAKPKTPLQNNNKTAGLDKITLADLSTTMNDKTPAKKRESGSEVPQSRKSSRRGNVSGDLFLNSAKLAQSVERNNFNKTATVKFGQYTVPNTTAVQKFYQSQSLKDAMTQEFAEDPHVHINYEADYYEAVKSLDVCGKCWADQKKYYPTPFKVNHKGPGQSLYQRDFVKHQLNDQGPRFKSDLYTTPKQNVPVDYATTMRNDFKVWNIGTPKRETMEFAPATTGMPMSGTSNYRLEYANWGANTAAYEKAPHNKTVITELPFMSSTTYGDNFAPTGQFKKVGLFKQKVNKSPLTTGVPFIGETTNSATYKPFKVAPVSATEKGRAYEKTEALPEDMRSLYSKDFPLPVQEKCPARVFIDNNAHPRFKHLST